MPAACFTVFGGTGFLGRRVVSRLLARGFSVRSVSRHPEWARESAMLAQVYGDIHDEESVAVVLRGARGAVNAISLYTEKGGETFHAAHVVGAARVARVARRLGVERFVHISGIGADPTSSSLYIAKRGEGEAAVKSTLPAAIIMRSAVMFGPDDAFLNTLVRLVRMLPVYPLFGRGDTRLQPACVEDVGEAVARALERDDVRGDVYEMGGPRVRTYRELVQTIAERLNKRRVLLPVPFSVWRVLARAAEQLPGPPLTRGQVELMEIDTVAAADRPGFKALGMSPQDIGETLDAIVNRSAGQRVRV